MSQSTQISTFNFESNSIRTLAINDEPWFVAKDVCDAIGIDNNRKALLALDEDEKGVTLSNTLGGKQEMNIVSESGMYTLILRCRDAVKKGSVPHRFRKWVTAEVLPQIRKTGKYEHRTTVDDRTGLRNAVNMLVSKKGLIYSEAYNLVHQYMNVESIEDIPADKLQSAVEYVHRIVLEGELITEVKENGNINAELTEQELKDLAWLWKIAELMRGQLYVLYDPLDKLGSHYAPSVYSKSREYRFPIETCRKILVKLTQHIQTDKLNTNGWSNVLYELRKGETNMLY